MEGNENKDSTHRDLGLDSRRSGCGNLNCIEVAIWPVEFSLIHVTNIYIFLVKHPYKMEGNENKDFTDRDLRLDSRCSRYGGLNFIYVEI